ncbi:MAG: N-acetyltransferase [Anaerolineales bacterium]|nr:MAG: N-acetyltransferase [Anaerolineales bacterium]
MSYTLVPMTEEHLQPAVELFIQGYQREQSRSTLLPSRVVDEPVWIYAALQSQLSNPGVAVFEQNHLVAYMVTSGQFLWKGQQAAIVHEYCHSAIAARKQELYQRMYMYLAQAWVNLHCHLHLIGHFAHDTLLQETPFHLGFGAIVAERLRDHSPITDRENIAIRVEQDMLKLIDIHMAHMHYYPQSPIFLSKPADRQEALADLEAHAARGDVFLVYYVQNQPCAYMIVGESTLEGEGFLLQQTNTAQIKAAYAQPDFRGKGIGTALLHRVIEWSQHQGYDRVFVEHETANFFGGNFWSKYFTPYLYYSMRYIDNSL